MAYSNTLKAYMVLEDYEDGIEAKYFMTKELAQKYVDKLEEETAQMYYQTYTLDPNINTIHAYLKHKASKPRKDVTLDEWRAHVHGLWHPDEIEIQES